MWASIFVCAKRFVRVVEVVRLVLEDCVVEVVAVVSRGRHVVRKTSRFLFKKWQRKLANSVREISLSFLIEVVFFLSSLNEVDFFDIDEDPLSHIVVVHSHFLADLVFNTRILASV